MATQRERILKMLEGAGERGISSKAIYREFIGRGGARIKELRELGYAIDSSERDPEDPKYVIYKLHPAPAGEGVLGARRPDQARGNEGEAHVKRDASPQPSLVGSSAEGDGLMAPSEPERPAPVSVSAASSERSVPNMFDPDCDWSTAA